MNLNFTQSSSIAPILIIVAVVIFYFSFKNLAFIRKNPIFLILRLLILVFLIALLFDPVLENKVNIEKKLNWHLYLDNSLSIKYHKKPSSIAYKSGVQRFLSKLREKGVNVETFYFGSAIDTMEDISKIKLNANSTNIGLVFNKIVNDFKEDLAGVIIFTDGQINQGLPIKEFYNLGSKIPINIVGIGDTDPMLDVFIKSIDTQPICVKGDKVDIDVIVSSVGKINERVNVTLFDAKNKLIGSKIIKISGNDANEIVRFQITPDKIGKNIFIVKCSALSDEINIQNNQQKITMHVMKNLYNIALVTGAPSYNTKVIKRFLSTTGNNKVDHFIIDEKNFNNRIKDFLEKKYEVIIFDNNPVSSNAKKWDSIVRVFAKKLISHNSSFFIVPGPEIDVHSLNKYLKIIDLEVGKLLEKRKDKVQWKFSDSWFELQAIKNKSSIYNYSSYPPQNPAFMLVNDSKNKSNIVHASYLDNGKENSLLLIGEKKSIRYAIWNSINFASLKYFTTNSNVDFLFENSMKKIISWLKKKNNKSDFVFRTDKNSYQHGESVLLSGISSDINNDFIINDGIVELYQNGEYISSKPLFFDLNENVYKSNFWAPKPGDIEYVIKLNKGLESYQVSSGLFKVQESHIEMNRIFLNENKLISLSESTGGKFKSWKEMDSLIDYINNVKQEESYVAFFKLRYNYFYLSFLFILFFAEWFYRRQAGLN